MSFQSTISSSEFSGLAARIYADNENQTMLQESEGNIACNVSFVVSLMYPGLNRTLDLPYDLRLDYH